MAKQFEVNREQYKKARKMDHNQFIDYVRGVYEKGRAAGQQDTDADGAGRGALRNHADKTASGFG